MGEPSTTAETRRPRRRWASGLVLLLAIGVLGACSGADEAMSGDVDAAAPDAGSVAEEPAADDGFDRDVADEGGASGESGTAPTDPDAASAGRQVIRTAELVLEVADPADAADQVGRIATAAGGYVAETDLQRDAQGVVRGTIVVRVPSGELLATVDAFDALAVAVPVKRVEEVDVTLEVVDLEARIANLTAYERELTALLTDIRERTSRPDDLLQVFERVRQVRGELDQTQARLDAIADRVSLSTVTVTLVPAPSSLPVADPTWEPGQTARDALSATVAAFTTLADLAIRFVITFLPLALLVAVPLGVVIAIANRRRRSRPGGPGEPPVPGTTTDRTPPAAGQDAGS